MNRSINALHTRENGADDGRFLRKLTTVCVVVFLVSGLVVYWIDQATTPDRLAIRPDGRQSQSHAKAQPEPGAGGGRCAR